MLTEKQIMWATTAVECGWKACMIIAYMAVAYSGIAMASDNTEAMAVAVAPYFWVLFLPAFIITIGGVLVLLPDVLLAKEEE